MATVFRVGFTWIGPMYSNIVAWKRGEHWLMRKSAHLPNHCPPPRTHAGVTQLLIACALSSIIDGLRRVAIYY